MYARWSRWNLHSESKYSSLPDEEEPLHSPEETFLEQKSSKQTIENISPTLLKILMGKLWMATTFIFVLSTIALALENRSMRNKPSYEAGFSTDLASAQGIAGLVQYHFTGGLELDADNNLYRVSEPGQPQYVGEPSSAIDNSWEDIMMASEIVLEGSEAREVAGKTIAEPNGQGWRLELDAYHSLHCVNEIRKALDVDHYYPKGTPYFFRVHIDHCLDYLRQVVQCQADMTPLTFYWEPRVNASMPIFGAPHTCRNWDQVHAWALQRRGLDSVV